MHRELLIFSEIDNTKKRLLCNKNDISTIETKAKEYLAQSGNCAQSSFAVLQDEFDLDSEDILKALTPFPGLALRGETCGAVTGSLMALGLVYGRDQLSNQRGYVASLSSARKFCTKFEDQFGSTSCSKILKQNIGASFNLADSKEVKQYLQEDGQKICGEIVAYAAQVAADLIKRKPGMSSSALL